MTHKLKFPNIFFGWWTVLAGGLIALLGNGFVSNGFSVLFKPIAEELGLSRAALSLASSAQTLGRQGIGGLFAGWASDKFGPRRVIIIGIILLGVGCLLMYFVHSLWVLIIVWGFVIGGGVALGFEIPIDKAIVNWFVKKRGLTLGVKFTIEAFAGIVILPALAWLLTMQGWRMTTVISGVVIALLSMTLAWFFIRNHRPEYYNLLPDGDLKLPDPPIQPGKVDTVNLAPKSEESEFTLKQTLHTFPFWVLVVIGCLNALVMPIMRLHSIPFLTDIGYSTVQAAAMMGTQLTASIPARIVTGFIVDRVKINHLRFIVAAGYTLQAIGVGIFLLNKSTPMIYLWFVLAGLGQGASFGATLPLIARYYGRKAYGSIDGTRMLMMVPVSLIAPVYTGWVYDTTNSYMSLFGIFGVLLVVAAVSACLAVPPRPPAHVDTRAASAKV